MHDVGMKGSWRRGGVGGLHIHLRLREMGCGNDIIQVRFVLASCPSVFSYQIPWFFFGGGFCRGGVGSNSERQERAVSSEVFYLCLFAYRSSWEMFHHGRGLRN